MRREVVWSKWNGTGAEHLLLEVGQDGLIADGLVVGVDDGEQPLRVHYEVRCDVNWNVRTVKLYVPSIDPATPTVSLLADGEGNWTTHDGEPMRELEGCMDVDISATPFTNTLPIRRLGLAPGESADILVAYLNVKKMRTWTEEQRYTRLDPNGDEVYKYESLDGGFTADLLVDSDGLVLDYPCLFRRIASFS